MKSVSANTCLALITTDGKLIYPWFALSRISGTSHHSPSVNVLWALLGIPTEKSDPTVLTITRLSQKISQHFRLQFWRTLLMGRVHKKQNYCHRLAIISNRPDFLLKLK